MQNYWIRKSQKGFTFLKSHEEKTMILPHQIFKNLDKKYQKQSQKTGYKMEKNTWEAYYKKLFYFEYKKLLQVIQTKILNLWILEKT